MVFLGGLRMNKITSTRDRLEVLDQLQAEEFELLIIGGGITGSGIALDAASRGIKTALVEMQDFASGTSSRSTKLVHGGLRYLKQYEVKMVAEVGKERAVVYENGPHVTTPEWMLLPLYQGGTFGTFSTSIGLRVYDFLAGVKRKERRKMLNRETTLLKEPSLKKEGLKGSGFYVEYRTDDSRLTIEVLKEAIEHGAVARNYTKVEEFIYEAGKAVGVVVSDQLTGATGKIRAKIIINATGPWGDFLREKDRSKNGKELRLTKGVHIVFDQSKFPLKQAIYFDVPDGRMLFAIPRGGKTYVGTTDTNYKGDIANPQMSKEDLSYIVKAIHFMFPDVLVTENDIESSWAGLRPLIHEEGKNPSEISRKDEIWYSDSGIMTIAGGKLTGYRKMAETIVDEIILQMKKEEPVEFTPCKTKDMPISGGFVGGSSGYSLFVKEKRQEGMALGFSESEATLLARVYGSNVDVLFSNMKEANEKAAKFELSPFVYSVLKYSIDYEMTVTPTDFFFRRTGAALFNISWVHEWSQQVINLMAHELKWSTEEKQTMTAELNNQLKQAVTAV
jgi:glycerol-3-phosphate dehydrogenase